MLVIVIFVLLISSGYSKDWAKDLNKDLNTMANNYVTELDAIVEEARETELKNVTGSVSLSNKLHAMTETTLDYIEAINGLVTSFRKTLKGKYDKVKENYNAVRFVATNWKNRNWGDMASYVWAL